MPKKIALLGSTGFIGRNTLKIASDLGFDVVAMAAKSNIDLLEEQARIFHPQLIAVFEEGPARVLQDRLPHIPVLWGDEGLREVARFEMAEFVMLAMTGSCGIVPALAAIEAGKSVGLANKEALVSAGELICRLAREKGVDLIPVDSEQCALFQVLRKEKKGEVRRLILTASGGPFINKRIEELARVTPEEAAFHRNFAMGMKTGVDSSTLMNKGLEMIEAKWLFDMDAKKIEAIIHPEQRIQSCVEFVDGSILAQMCEPDMRLPIQYAMTYPERREGSASPYDFSKNGTLTFFEPDKEKFRCFQLALDALHAGMSYPCFLNAANEVLVERFLNKNISWMAISEKLEKLISSHDPENLLTLEAILEVDRNAREKARVV